MEEAGLMLDNGHISQGVIYDHFSGVLQAMPIHNLFPDTNSLDLGKARLYGFETPSFRIRARRVLRLRPRISAAPFLPLTFHPVCSRTRMI